MPSNPQQPQSIIPESLDPLRSIEAGTPGPGAASGMLEIDSADEPLAIIRVSVKLPWLPGIQVYDIPIEYDSLKALQPHQRPQARDKFAIVAMQRRNDKRAEQVEELATVTADAVREALREISRDELMDRVRAAATEAVRAMGGSFPGAEFAGMLGGADG